MNGRQMKRKASSPIIIPDNVGARDLDPAVLARQIGSMNIMAISGGRVTQITNNGRPVGIYLPVAQGYAVAVYLADNDTYTVQRLYRNKVKGEATDIYAEDVGEIAYRAGMYHDDFITGASCTAERGAPRSESRPVIDNGTGAFWFWVGGMGESPDWNGTRPPGSYGGTPSTKVRADDRDDAIAQFEAYWTSMGWSRVKGHDTHQFKAASRRTAVDNPYEGDANPFDPAGNDMVNPPVPESGATPAPATPPEDEALDNTIYPAMSSKPRGATPPQLDPANDAAKEASVKYPVKCLACGQRGKLSGAKLAKAVTSPLRCKCGSTDIDLDDGPAPARRTAGTTASRRRTAERPRPSCYVHPDRRSVGSYVHVTPYGDGVWWPMCEECKNSPSTDLSRGEMGDPVAVQGSRGTWNSDTTRGAAFTPGEEAGRRAYDEQQAEMARRGESITRRLLDAYRNESDREYADEFYGDLLRERGIDPLNPPAHLAARRTAASGPQVLVAMDWKDEGLSPQPVLDFLDRFDALLDYSLGTTPHFRSGEPITAHRFTFDASKIRDTEVHAAGFQAGFVVHIEDGGRTASSMVAKTSGTLWSNLPQNSGYGRTVGDFFVTVQSEGGDEWRWSVYSGWGAYNYGNTPEDTGVSASDYEAMQDGAGAAEAMSRSITTASKGTPGVVAKIEREILSTNPGLSPTVARQVAARTAARMAPKTAMPNPVDLGVKVGDFFVASWGYDQTNVDFYEVVGLTAASVRVVPVGKRVVSENQNMTHVVPVPGDFQGEVMTKRVQGGRYEREDPSIKIDSYSTARLWDGEPRYETAQGWGH